MLRDDAWSVFAAGLEAADPGRAVGQALRLGLGGGAVVARDEVVFPGRLKVVAIGKAACVMARAAVELLSPQAFPGPGIAVVNDPNAAPVERFRVLTAGHPLPDQRGQQAAQEVERYLAGARREDGVLVLISGGGSALLPAPATGISLADKTEVTRQLLRSGADIGELNTVRKHLSRLKGGQLAARAFPASLEALILSDVLGDDLGTIASGLTAPDPTTFADARAVLERRGVWGSAPAAVRERLGMGCAGSAPETPKPRDPIFARVRNRIVGSNALSLEAASKKAAELGYRVHVASRALVGEAREAAASLRASLEAQLSAVAGPLAVLAGGETTVTVRGAGRGGRNQELSLAFARDAAARPLPRPWALLSAGTDGQDGPTDAAGAVVDAGTVARGARAGKDAGRSLEENDSHAFLDASGDLLRTGATGTNVADLQVLLVEA